MVDDQVPLLLTLDQAGLLELVQVIGELGVRDPGDLLDHADTERMHRERMNDSDTQGDGEGVVDAAGRGQCLCIRQPVDDSPDAPPVMRQSSTVCGIGMEISTLSEITKPITLSCIHLLLKPASSMQDGDPDER